MNVINQVLQLLQEGAAKQNVIPSRYSGVIPPVTVGRLASNAKDSLKRTVDLYSPYDVNRQPKTQEQSNRDLATAVSGSFAGINTVKNKIAKQVPKFGNELRNAMPAWASNNMLRKPGEFEGTGKVLKKVMGKVSDADVAEVNLSEPLAGTRRMLREPAKVTDKTIQAAKSKVANAGLYDTGKTYYRGEGASRGKGNYFTDNKEFANEFAGIKPLTKVKIPDSSIYRPKELPFAGNEQQLTQAIAEAKSKGFKAVAVSEGSPFGKPVESVFVIDKSVAIPRVAQPVKGKK